MKHFNSKLITAAVIAASVSQFTTTSAFAEGLEEVVVTAERRDRDVQDIPISMTALSAEQLENKAVTRLDDLAYASPGLTITDAGLTQSVNIRGIGLASGDPDVTNGVGTYIDGLFQPPIVSTLDFYDIAGVQVLRGPQGTFAGANSTGGAIMIGSRRPDVGGETSGYVTLGAGNYGATEASGAINLPMGDTFAARVAINKKDRNSFFDSIGPEKADVASLDETDYRIGLQWNPSDNLEIYVKWEDSEKDSGGYAHRPVPNTQFAAGRTDDMYTVSYNTPSMNDEKAETALIDIKYRLDNGITLTWLSGDQYKEITNIVDTDATSISSQTMDQYVTEDQISHEFNIISADDADIQWVGGAYYQKNDVLVDITNNAAAFPVDIDIQNYKIIKGLFGQIGFQASEDLLIEIGARKAWFENGVDEGSGVRVGRGIISPTGIPVAVIDGTYEDSEVVGKLSATYTLDADNMVYAFVARGAKPGGINSSISTFDTEKVISYEAGWKGTMADGMLRSSINLFYNDYTNFQSNNIDITTGRSDVYNVADATIQGIEASLEAQMGAVLVDASITVVDSELEPTQPIVNIRTLPAGVNVPQCAAGADASAGTCFDYGPYIADVAGGPNLLAPKTSFTIGAEYQAQLNNGATLTPRLNFSYMGEQWTNFLYNPTTDLLEARDLWSAMVTYEKDNFTLRGWARNLTNSEYVSGQAGNKEMYGSPRTYGVTATFNF
jgi:iron complex outermembrane receptor protein